MSEMWKINPRAMADFLPKISVNVIANEIKRESTLDNSMSVCQKWVEYSQYFQLHVPN